MKYETVKLMSTFFDEQIKITELSLVWDRGVVRIDWKIKAWGGVCDLLMMVVDLNDSIANKWRGLWIRPPDYTTNKWLKLRRQLRCDFKLIAIFCIN